jgi:hypothetical protein
VNPSPGFFPDFGSSAGGDRSQLQARGFHVFLLSQVIHQQLDLARRSSTKQGEWLELETSISFTACHLHSHFGSASLFANHRSRCERCPTGFYWKISHNHRRLRPFAGRRNPMV